MLELFNLHQVDLIQNRRDALLDFAQTRILRFFKNMIFFCQLKGDTVLQGIAGVPYNVPVNCDKYKIYIKP